MITGVHATVSFPYYFTRSVVFCECTLENRRLGFFCCDNLAWSVTSAAYIASLVLISCPYQIEILIHFSTLKGRGVLRIGMRTLTSKVTFWKSTWEFSKRFSQYIHFTAFDEHYFVCKHNKIKG